MVSGPVLALTTAVVALVGALLVYTDLKVTLQLHVHTTSENAFRFMANPMVIKETHPLVVGIEIKSQRKLEEVSGDYFEVSIEEKLPLVGHHTMTTEMFTNKEALTITNLAAPLWGLMAVNVTYTFSQAGPAGSENCLIHEVSHFRLPWVLSFYVKAEAERLHAELLNKTKHTLERFTNK